MDDIVELLKANLSLPIAFVPSTGAVVVLNFTVFELEPVTNVKVASSLYTATCAPYPGGEDKV